MMIDHHINPHSTQKFSQWCFICLFVSGGRERVGIPLKLHSKIFSNSYYVLHIHLVHHNISYFFFFFLSVLVKILQEIITNRLCIYVDTHRARERKIFFKELVHEIVETSDAFT